MVTLEVEIPYARVIFFMAVVLHHGGYLLRMNHCCVSLKGHRKVGLSKEGVSHLVGLSSRISVLCCNRHGLRGIHRRLDRRCANDWRISVPTVGLKKKKDWFG